LEHFDISVRSVHENFGVRGRSVADKLAALEGTIGYLVVGNRAAYHYHHWRTPASGGYELLISPTDFDTWYAYLRDAHTSVGKQLPESKERLRYAESVVLIPELTDELWRHRVWVEEVAYIAPVDLLFRLMVGQTEAAVGETLAILVARREVWDWEMLVATIKAKRFARQFGCLFEVLNLEAGRPLFPQEAVDQLFSVVQDTVGEAIFTFPLQERQKASSMATAPDEYVAVGERWGLDLRISRNLVAKVLDDLGV
jgi:hypothetical protein